jgi:phosphatidylserine/phosphatidylglycerophosphate/cardiolipin synthase-like enzyme
MHHKFALVDGDRLLAGSYNLGSSGPYARNFLVRMDQHAERFAVEAEALWMLPDSKRLLLPHQALQLLAVALEPGARRQRSGTEKLLRDIDGNVLRRGWMTEAEEGAVRGIIRKSGRSQPDLPERRDIKGIDTELGF